MKKTLLTVFFISFACLALFSSCAHNHSCGEWTTVKEATCTELGKQERICECGEKETKDIEKLAHTELIDGAIDATCVSIGISEGKHCSVCNTIIVPQKPVAAKGHTEVIDAAVPATCTTAGKTEGKHCSVCNVITVLQTETPIVPHIEVTDNGIEPTCTSIGISEGKHCSVCNTITVAPKIIKAKGHSEVFDIAIAATCTTNGKTWGKHCSVCNTVIIPQTPIVAKGHTKVIDPAVAPTCIESGKTEGIHCSVCNAIIVTQTEIQALGHKEVIDTAIAATCTTEGKTEGKHCSICNKTLVAQTIISKVGHSEVIDVSILPTCTNTGLSEGTHCEICKEVLKPQEVVGPHIWDLKNVTLNPICTKTYSCKICKTSKTEAVEIDDTNPTTWKFLFVVLENTSLNTFDSNSNQEINVSHILSDKQYSAICKSINDFQEDMNGIADGRFVFDISTVKCSAEMSNYSKISHGYYINSKSAVDYLLSQNINFKDYDHVVFVSCFPELPRTYWGLGGTYLNKYVGYSQIVYGDWCEWYCYDVSQKRWPAGVFVHEFLHFMETYSKEFGYNPPSPDKAESYGYENVDDWRNFYTDFINNKIYYNGKYTGIPEFLWQYPPTLLN